MHNRHPHVFCFIDHCHQLFRSPSRFDSYPHVHSRFSSAGAAPSCPACPKGASEGSFLRVRFFFPVRCPTVALDTFPAQTPALPLSCGVILSAVAECNFLRPLFAPLGHAVEESLIARPRRNSPRLSFRGDRRARPLRPILSAITEESLITSVPLKIAMARIPPGIKIHRQRNPTLRIRSWWRNWNLNLGGVGPFLPCLLRCNDYELFCLLRFLNSQNWRPASWSLPATMRPSHYSRCPILVHLPRALGCSLGGLRICFGVAAFYGERS
jgi:hypothetical protein